jgi:phosphoribosylformylglycinamidine synthase
VTKVGTDVPTVDYVKNTKIYLALEKAIAKGLVASSISVNSGGLGIALARASLGGMLGTTITLDKLKGSASTIDAKLFSESQGRIVVSIARKNMKAFENLMKGVSFTKIGIVSNTKKFIILEKKKKVVDTNIEKLYDVYHKFSQKMS